jgi:hypothetical protein
MLLFRLVARRSMPRAGWHKVRHHAASSLVLQIHSGVHSGMRGIERLDGKAKDPGDFVSR